MNNSLRIKKSGIAHILVNKQQKSSCQFLFHFDELEKNTQNFTNHLEDFLKWLSSLHHQKAIFSIELASNHVHCQHGHTLPPGKLISLADILIPRQTLRKISLKLAQKYRLAIDLDTQNIEDSHSLKVPPSKKNLKIK